LKTIEILLVRTLRDKDCHVISVKSRAITICRRASPMKLTHTILLAAALVVTLAFATTRSVQFQD
jgi:hypothetical protein